mmetsp:Transcript_28451/g.32720  ORF Transcript_28451/g.32720 Transcript_28451/m.32720 type:complete len:80 (-) Transcript_28451:12-251(-)
MISCQELECLDIEELYHITDACFHFASDEKYYCSGKSSLAALKELNISHCSGISNEGIIALSNVIHVQTLSRLKISGLH